MVRAKGEVNTSQITVSCPLPLHLYFVFDKPRRTIDRIEVRSNGRKDILRLDHMGLEREIERLG